MSAVARATGSVALACVGALISSCGLVSNSVSGAQKAAGLEPFEGPVPVATCSPGDLTEPALQGQVPPEDRASGRSALSPYTCNLELVGQWTTGADGGNAPEPALGDGAGWQHAWFEDCAYYGTGTGRAPENGSERPAQANPGVVVVDAADSTRPVATAFLDTSAMLDPWESLKVNNQRQLLAAADGNNGGGGPIFDIYDISGDCTQPRLLASGPVGSTNGHAGHFTPDGLTYYASYGVTAIDIRDPAAPVALAEGLPRDGDANGTHDLSFNKEGTRAYMTNPSCGNGLKIVDVSQVQARVPDPQVQVISELCWTDGGTDQHTQPITIRGVPYILFVDEGGLAASASGGAAGPAGAARLIDITDERNPVIASKLKLEVHMPENSAFTKESVDGTIFGYQAHYCTASDGRTDNHNDPVPDTAIIICGYFQSGIRVFDVRNPYKPREIAYYNPPARPGYHAGSTYNLTGVCGTADWATANSRYRPDRNEIWFTSQCNGFQIARFTRPLAELLGPVPQ
jgi:hypothetical protein